MYPSFTITRDVWREVTKTPCAPIRELARRTGHGTRTVHDALVSLRQRGYIAFADRAEGARRVLVPFAEVA